MRVMSVEYMSEKTKEQLGLTWILKRLTPYSPLGRTAKSRMKPFDIDTAQDLKKELNRVFYICGKLRETPGICQDIQSILREVKDITGSIKRAQKGGVLDEVEFFELKAFVMYCARLEKLIRNFDLDIKVQSVNKLMKLLDPKATGRKSFFIEDEFSPRLKWVRKRIRQVKKEMKQEEGQLKSRVEKVFGVNVNPWGEININKGDERIQQLNTSPLVSYVRENFAEVVYSPKPSEKLIELKAKLEKLQQMESDEEFEVRKKLTGEVERYSQLLLKNAENIGRLDLLFAKARLAVALKCTKPRIIKENVISIQQGRHPVVEEALKEKGLEFKPVDIYLSKPVTVITGANMGGKTVTLKMVGLLVAMGQMGLLVPAGEMFFSPRDFVFFSGSYGESLEDGLSAFGAEIKALSQVLNHIDKRGLVLIDELARGTNPLEGTAIARAVVARLVAGRCISIATTHFYEVSKLPGVVHLQVRGLKGVKAEKIKDELENGKTIGPELLNRIMDYTLEEVSADALPSHDAIKVARMMGFDEGTLKNAERFIKQEGEE